MCHCTMQLHINSFQDYTDSYFHYVSPHLLPVFSHYYPSEVGFLSLAGSFFPSLNHINYFLLKNLRHRMLLILPEESLTKVFCYTDCYRFAVKKLLGWKGKGLRTCKIANSNITVFQINTPPIIKKGCCFCRWVILKHRCVINAYI